jgi:hypothetical protein
LLAQVAEPAPAFASVWPDTAKSREEIWIDFVGATQVQHDFVARLEGSGLPTRSAVRTEWTDRDRVRARFDLSGLPNGHYDVVLTNPDGQGALLAGGLALAVALPTDGPLPAPSLALYQNAPNPFNPVTWIRFDLPQPTPVELLVFDARGRRVRLLLQARLPSGSHGVKWDGRDDAGRSVASGLYFYRLQAGDQILRRKMSLVR